MMKLRTEKSFACLAVDCVFSSSRTPYYLGARAQPQAQSAHERDLRGMQLETV
jgi:hypothetical protein